MRQVGIWVENQKLDLFNDENVVVNSSVQNISDITKVFTDFSQTFTVPCSINNNKIFEHYYNNDLDGFIDHNRRRAARVEIDGEPFRTGKIHLEKSEIKNNQAESYTVTFYGDVVTLKDLIMDDKLKDLDYSSLNFTYSGTQVKNRITTPSSTTDYDVRFPLISSSRVWQYNDATANDINTSGGRIGFQELFPAVRVKSIFDIIANQYGVNFIGSWIDNDRFKKLFMWFKNKEQFTYYTPAEPLLFADVQHLGGNIYGEVIEVSYVNPALLGGDAQNIQHNVLVNISTGSAIDYYLDVYENGVLTTSLPANGSQTFTIVANLSNNFGGTNGFKEYRFKVRSTQAMTFTGYGRHLLTWFDYTGVPPGFPTPNTALITGNVGSTSTNAYLDLSALAPDMKVLDFISGIFQVFNLTAYGISADTFIIEPLNSFYNRGTERNLTQYIDTESIEVNRPKLFNNISFEWQDSLSFQNRKFFDLFEREYGNLKASFGYDGGDLTVKLPFEHLLHQRFSNSAIHVGYCLGTAPEFKPYIPKPVLLYQNDHVTNESFYFYDGSTTTQLTQYVPFGSDASYTALNYTLTFGSEISSFFETIQDRSLYRTYYERYLSNLFNLKTRQVNVKAQLPLRLLNDLRLNDQIIIRDKKYLINEFKSNLNTGEVELQLLSNFTASQVYGKEFTITYESQVLPVDYQIQNNATITIGSPFETQFATPDITVLSGDVIVNFTCTQNTTGATRTNTFPLTIVIGGVTIPTQYIVIHQLIQPEFRVIEQDEKYGYRVTEFGENRIIE